MARTCPQGSRQFSFFKGDKFARRSFSLKQTLKPTLWSLTPSSIYFYIFSEMLTAGHEEAGLTSGGCVEVPVGISFSDFKS